MTDTAKSDQLTGDQRGEFVTTDFSQIPEDIGSLRSGVIGFETMAVLTPPKLSDWQCYMFGSRPNSWGIVWHPIAGQEPNWFWRTMQYLAFGNKWVKTDR